MFSPLAMPARQTAKTARPLVAALLDDEAPAIVRPGLREEVTTMTHDGVVKAKQVKPGMKVRAFLHGKPCGGERVVDTVTKVNKGAEVEITFSTPHPDTTYKAAYRFYVADLDGTEVRKVTRVPALVPYQEV